MIMIGWDIDCRFAKFRIHRLHLCSIVLPQSALSIDLKSIVYKGAVNKYINIKHEKNIITVTTPPVTISPRKSGISISIASSD